MASKTLPYLVAPGSLKSALERIQAAATPERVTGDFVTTKLQIKGGTGAAMIPYLKRVGFVNSDGTPTDLYKRFRNPAQARAAAADAVKIGYKPLGEINEYFYALGDKDLLGIIVQATGVEPKSKVASCILSTLKTLKSFADFEAKAAEMESKGSDATKQLATQQTPQHLPLPRGRVGLNLSYTINLNLPATTDQAVFNAIFKSLKEHLLSHGEE